MANGLINLQTDLKSLKFTSIPPSGQEPYIVKDIGANFADRLTGGEGTIVTGLLENGLGTQIDRRIDDTTRIAKMLVDRPGIKFLINQALLQQVGLSRKLREAKEEGRQEGKTGVGAIIKQVAATAFNTAAIGVSILAQVPVAGTGIHLISGIRPTTYLRGGNATTDFSAIDNYLANDSPELTPEPGLPGDPIYGARLALAKKPINGTVDSNFYDSLRETRIVGQTSLDTSTFVNKYNPALNDPSDPESEVLSGNSSEDSDTIIRKVLSQPPYLETKRNYKTVREVEGKSQEKEFGDITIQSRLGLGGDTYYNRYSTYLSPGTKKAEAKKTNRYWYMSDEENKRKSEEVDRINVLDKIPIENTIENLKEENEKSDIIKFKFNILTPDSEEVLYFRAYLDNFNDSYTGQWNPVKYLGRAEDFQIYGGFQRKIGLSFKIAAMTRVEMRPLYRKMVLLASATAPTYASSGQFMRGTIVKMTVGDYVYELPGVLNSVSYAWEQDYPWEIAMLTPEFKKEDDMYDNDMQQLPMILNCQLDFTPIHTFTPQTGLHPFFTHKTPDRPNNILGRNPDVIVKDLEQLGSGLSEEEEKKVMEQAALKEATEISGTPTTTPTTTPTIDPTSVTTEIVPGISAESDGYKSDLIDKYY